MTGRSWIYAEKPVKIVILGHKMYEDRIVIDPAVRHGKPIIKGTHVPLEIILGSLAAGMDIAEIALFRKAFPL